MAINPFRIGELQIPANPKPVPLDFSPLQDLGASIGHYREQQDIGSLLAGATDATGNLDFNKAAAALAARGYTQRAKELADTASRQLALKQTAASMGETARAHKAHEDYLKAALEQQRQQFQEGKAETITIQGTNPDSEEKETAHILRRGPDGSLTTIYSAPWATPIPGAKPLVSPATPAPAVAPAPVVKPQSALPQQGGPSLAAFNPEEAPPYQVAAAGGAVPPPPQPQAATPATTEPVERVAQATELPAVTPSRKAQKTELGKEAGKIEADAVRDAKTAAELQPFFNDVVNTWGQLARFQRFGGISTGTGPIVGSDLGRLPQKLLGGSEEQLRQAYERSLATLRARITGLLNKGQGSVSNYERTLYNMVFPDVTTVNPMGDLALLRQNAAANSQILKTGRGTELGQRTPELLADRPEIERAPSVDEQQIARYRATPMAAIAQARRLINEGVDPAKVRDLLNKIDPSLPGKAGL